MSLVDHLVKLFTRRSFPYQPMIVNEALTRSAFSEEARA